MGCGLYKKDKSEGWLHAFLARTTRRMELSLVEMEKEEIRRLVLGCVKFGCCIEKAQEVQAEKLLRQHNNP